MHVLPGRPFPVYSGLFSAPRNWAAPFLLLPLALASASVDAASPVTAADGIQAARGAKLPGILLDDSTAERTGTWIDSTTVRPFVGGGYIHDDNKDKGTKSARFTFTPAATGAHLVLFSYTIGGTRATSVPVILQAADGTHTVHVNQKEKPSGPYGFHPLGTFKFEAGKAASIEVTTDGTDGHVIVDALLLLTGGEIELAGSAATTLPAAATASKLAAPKSPPPKTADAPPAAQPAAIAAPELPKRSPSRTVARLTPAELDARLEKHLGPIADREILDDEQFLRRATLDLIGRHPTPKEVMEFVADSSPGKRAAAIERLLADPDFGTNWANYWSDVMGYRMQEPELTFHDFRPLKKWLAEEFNAGRTWDETVYSLLTAQGKIGQNPAATFIGFHQADARKLAGETSRVFLGVQIACAECHDHPFVDMPQETFHGMAAFFIRAEAKIPQRDSDAIEVVSKNAGEHAIPGKKGDVQPTVLDGKSAEPGQNDLARRAMLAQWITSPDNPYFAKAFTNRVWGRLLGRGFCEPVDDLGEEADRVLRDVHQEVADHFIASGHDPRSVFRLVANTRAYQRSLAAAEGPGEKPFARAVAKKLRGDEVFASLAVGIGLPNYTPPQEKATGAIRFPPPPKSTRDLVNDAFGFDPSFKDENVSRTMSQALFMMNNEQVQAQIDARPDSGTLLAKLLADESDDKAAAIQLFLGIYGRRPTEGEMNLLLAHVARVKDRGKAFEDMMWSMINSAEFTTRR
jgi:hypothetical protein